MTTAENSPVKVEFKDLSPVTQTVNEAEGIVEAIVGVTGIEDHVGDVVVPGAYAKTLEVRNPKVCWGHDWKSPVGKVLEAREIMPGDPVLPAVFREKGAGALYVKTQFNMETQQGREAFSNVKFWGDEGEWSIGYDCTPGRGKTRRDAKGVRHIEALTLFEVSPVLHGAAPLTATLAVKSMAAGDMKSLDVDDFAEFLELKSARP